MNPPIDDIFNLFPAWFYLSPTSLDYCATLERPDRCHTESLPESMLEGYNSNPAMSTFTHPAFSTSLMPTPSFNELLNYDHEQDILFSPSSSLSSLSSFTSSSSLPTCQKSSLVKRNTRIGFCEHPKHVLYRQSHSTIVSNNKFIHHKHHQHQYQHSHHEKHCQKHICKKLCRHHHFLHHLNQQKETPSNDIPSIATTPRRGRPPKGAKSSERLSTDFSLFMDHHINHIDSHPVEKDNNNNNINYHIAMTTRPLPKRLESVVGKSNIYVCLTCLKRSDMDIDYLMDPAYIGPQSSKRRKNHLPPNLE